MPEPIRLYLLDDHALFRDGLERLLAMDPDFELAGAESDPGAAFEQLRAAPIDVLLLDYDLGPDHSSRDFVIRLRNAGFTARIVLVTAGLPDRDALDMIRAGVSGIFHKQRATADLRRSIREVHEGKVLVEEHYLRQLVSAATEPEPPTLRLTERERKILRYLIEGLANKEIAAELQVSESAVKAALQTLFSKTEVRTRTQLVRIALEQLRDHL